MKWMLGAGALFAATAPPPEPSLSLLAIILSGGIAGIGGVAFSWWRFKKLGPAERLDIERSSAEKAVAALDKALERYQRDMDRAQDAILRLERQLVDANDRILRLEEQLKHMTSDRDGIAKQLEGALKERAKLEYEIEMMRAELADLRRRLGSDPPEP